MKRTIVLFLAILIAEQSSAKKMVAFTPVPKPQYAVKVYNTFSYQTTKTFGLPYGPPSSVTTTKKMDVLNPSVAFMWTDKKGHTREIELSSFNINNRKYKTTYGSTAIMGYAVTTYDIALRVERIFNFAKRKNWKLKPALGVGVSPYFNMEKVTPYISSVIPSTDTRYGLKAYFTPRINYNISNRFFIDLNIPVTVANMGVVYQKVFVPSVGSEMPYTTGNFDAISELPSVRLGVGLRL